MIIDIEPYLAKLGLLLRGVLHVGAHRAEEEPLYLRHLPHDKIVWVEANPTLVHQLVNEDSRRIVYSALLADTDGQICTFHVTNNLASSSMLELDYHKQAHPWVVETNQLYLASHKGDTLLLNTVIDKNINFCNLDIQGAELLALKGMVRILEHMDIVYVEVNVKTLYKDCALLPELEEFLGVRGFDRVAIELSEHGWGDALYVRKPQGIIGATIGGWPRLGNQMFQYAYLKTMSLKYNLVLCIDKDYSAYGFQLHAFPEVTYDHEYKVEDFVVKHENSFGYDPSLVKFNPSANRCLVRGGLQDWRYFDEYKADIVHAFTFPQDVVQEARALTGARAYIALHLRLPDTYGETGFVYTTPTLEFVRKSLRAVRATEDSLIYVLSNNISWCEELYGKQVDEFTLEYIHGSQMADLCAIANANAVIVSASTFSWMGAYLNKKTPKVAIIEPWFNPVGSMAHADTSGLYYPGWIKCGC